MTNIREKAERALCEFIGNGKSFREGQYEAIVGGQAGGRVWCILFVRSFCGTREKASH